MAAVQQRLIEEKDYLLANDSNDVDALSLIANAYLTGSNGLTKDLKLAAYYMQKLSLVDKDEAETLLGLQADYLCDEFSKDSYPLSTYELLRKEINTVSQMMLCYTDFYTSLYKRHTMTTRSRTFSLKASL